MRALYLPFVGYAAPPSLVRVQHASESGPPKQSPNKSARADTRPTGGSGGRRTRTRIDTVKAEAVNLKVKAERNVCPLTLWHLLSTVDCVV